MWHELRPEQHHDHDDHVAERHHHHAENDDYALRNHHEANYAHAFRRDHDDDASSPSPPRAHGVALVARDYAHHAQEDDHHDHDAFVEWRFVQQHRFDYSAAAALRITRWRPSAR